MTATQGFEVGAQAPDIQLNGSKGNVSLAQFRGKSSVVLFFMRDFGCHTCIGHVLELTKAFAQFQARGAEVLVLGGGSVANATKLAERYKFPFPILADTDHSVYDRYGLDKVLLYWQKSGSFVIDPSGKVVHANSSTGPGGSLNLAALIQALS